MHRTKNNNTMEYIKPYYFYSKMDINEKYKTEKVYINAKFYDDHNYDVTVRYEFAFFHGTRSEWDDLLSEHQDVATKFGLRFRFLTDDEIRRKLIPIRNLSTKWSKRQADYKYLASKY